jgi:aryl-alcohol dehydrogenase-like predicted oxidoreductase
LTRIDRLVLGSADLRDDAVTPRLLDRFHEAGGRALDVANVYADGASEQAVGGWLSRTGATPRLFVKGCHPPFCSPSLVGAEVDTARSNLGRETLDVFMLHRDDLAVPAAAWAEALGAELERGSVQRVGVSNWTMERFHALRAELGADAGRLAVFSNHFSLVAMVTPTWPGTLGMSKADVAVLEGAGVTALAWASLAAGYFARHGGTSWDSPENDARRRRSDELAAREGRSPVEVALAYVLHQGPNVLAAVGTRSEAHLAQLLHAATLDLSVGELAWLETG